MGQINPILESMQHGDIRSAMDQLKNLYEGLATLQASVDSIETSLDAKVDLTPATSNVQTGNFEYGVLNGAVYNGVINKSSTLKHYGRISDPADVVNVSFVQKTVNPAIVLAQNAIQRNGDTVGLATGTTRYNYLFRNCDINLGSASYPNGEVKYYGPITDLNHIATKDYVDDKVVITEGSSLTQSIIDIGGVTFLSLSGPAYDAPNTESTITLPITFSSILSVQLSMHSTVDNNDCWYQVRDITTSSISIELQSTIEIADGSCKPLLLIIGIR